MTTVSSAQHALTPRSPKRFPRWSLPDEDGSDDDEDGSDDEDDDDEDEASLTASTCPRRDRSRSPRPSHSPPQEEEEEEGGEQPPPKKAKVEKDAAKKPKKEGEDDGEKAEASGPSNRVPLRGGRLCSACLRSAALGHAPHPPPFAVPSSPQVLSDLSGDKAIDTRNIIEGGRRSVILHSPRSAAVSLPPTVQDQLPRRARKGRANVGGGNRYAAQPAKKKDDSDDDDW